MYRTDLTEIEWQDITKVLNQQERKRKYDLRIIWNAISYLAKKGLYSGMKVLLADGGYRKEVIENIKSEFGYIIQVVINFYKEQGLRPHSFIKDGL